MMMKILKTSNIENINFSLYNFGQLPLDLKLLIRKTRHFNQSINQSINSFIALQKQKLNNNSSSKHQ